MITTAATIRVAPFIIMGRNRDMTEQFIQTSQPLAQAGRIPAVADA